MEKDVMAEIPQRLELSQKLAITFELLTDEGKDDPALIRTVGHDAVAALQQEGYTVCSSVYTGQKGTEGFIVDLMIMIQQIATIAKDHHVAVAEGIADLSGLITIFSSLLPLFKRTQQTYEKYVGKEESVTRPIKITIEIDDVPLVIEASDIMQAEAALKLALKYRSAYPVAASQVTIKSNVKVRGQMPTRKRRPRK